MAEEILAISGCYQAEAAPGVTLTELPRSPRIESRKEVLMLFEQPQSAPVEPVPAPTASGQGRVLQYVLLAIAVIYVIASLYLLFDLRKRLTAVEQQQQTLETAQAELNNRIHATSTEFKQALSSEVGMTKAEIAQRAAELERQQKASAAKLAADAFCWRSSSAARWAISALVMPTSELSACLNSVEVA